MIDQIPLQVPHCRAHHDEPNTHIERCPSHKFHDVCSITREPTDGNSRYHTASHGLRQDWFFAVIPPTYPPQSAPDASAGEYEPYGTPRASDDSSYGQENIYSHGRARPSRRRIEWHRRAVTPGRGARPHDCTRDLYQR